jgi:hypothetical protein
MWRSGIGGQARTTVSLERDFRGRCSTSICVTQFGPLDSRLAPYKTSQC